MLVIDNIGVEELSHDLQLSIFVPLILIDLLNRHLLASLCYGSLRMEKQESGYGVKGGRLTWKTTPKEPLPTTLSAL